MRRFLFVQESVMTTPLSTNAGNKIDKYTLPLLLALTPRDIQGHLQEIYGIDVSPALISQITDAIS